MTDITKEDREMAGEILLKIFPQDSLLAGNNKNENMILAIAALIAERRKGHEGNIKSAMKACDDIVEMANDFIVTRDVRGLKNYAGNIKSLLGVYHGGNRCLK